jgi:hypothetical protein
VASIVLGRPAPERLSYSGSDWRLRVIAFEAVDRDVFAPVATEHHGREAILAALAELERQSCETFGAAQILDRPPSKPTNFVLKEGRWIASIAAGTRTSSRPPSQLLHKLSDVQNELAQLRTRVRELEHLLVALDPNRAQTSNENATTHESATLDAV